MMGMLGKVKEAQAKMKQAQDQLANIEELGEAGAGMVKVTVNGLKRVINISIDPDILKPEDAELVQDLVVAATNKALEKVEDKAKDYLQKATEGLIPNIPGMDLGKIFG